MVTKECKISGAPFYWSDSDQTLLDKLAPTLLETSYPFPPPTIGPKERKRRRLAFRNERTLYHRVSSLSGKPIISMYSPDKPFPVFAKEEYWSDACNPLSYGMDYDFSKSFFEQLLELKRRVPRVALITDPDADKNNCAYINYAGFSKNCYMAFNADENQDCCYISNTFNSRDCLDSTHMHHCELCYECVGCTKCWSVSYSQDCTDCSSSSFLFCCVGCSNCFCCANLIKREYCIENVQYSKADYFSEMEKYNLRNRSTVALVQQRFSNFLKGKPRRYAQILRSENCSGDYIRDSKDCSYCFNIHDCRDVHYSDIVHHATDCMDLSAFGVGAELVYNSTSIGVHSSRIYCSYACVIGSSDLMYCDECRQSKNCFGCISLKQSSYCILNKQYTKDEYFALVPKIISHLQETGEWGEFFPYALSSFGYNETVAQERFPLTEGEALARGISWHIEERKGEIPGIKHSSEIPDAIDDVTDEITRHIIACSSSGKPFRISTPEFHYYKKNGHPVPILSPDTRYMTRALKRNNEELYERTCSRTGETLITTYPPEFLGEVVGERAYWDVIGSVESLKT